MNPAFPEYWGRAGDTMMDKVYLHTCNGGQHYRNIQCKTVKVYISKIDSFLKQVKLLKENNIRIRLLYNLSLPSTSISND